MRGSNTWKRTGSTADAESPYQTAGKAAQERRLKLAPARGNVRHDGKVVVAHALACCGELQFAVFARSDALDHEYPDASVANPALTGLSSMYAATRSN